jgi:hypothetical protein
MNTRFKRTPKCTNKRMQEVSDFAPLATVHGRLSMPSTVTCRTLLRSLRNALLSFPALVIQCATYLAFEDSGAKLDIVVLCAGRGEGVRPLVQAAAAHGAVRNARADPLVWWPVAALPASGGGASSPACRVSKKQLGPRQSSGVKAMSARVRGQATTLAATVLRAEKLSEK